MKSWFRPAIVGGMAGLVCLMGCGGEPQSGIGEKKVEAPLPVKAIKGPAEDKAVGKETPQAGAQKPAPFSAEMSAEFMRKVMETSARIEAVKTKIAERQKVIYDTNPDVKAYRAQLVAMQGEISKIMEADAELAELKLNRDILWTTMPTLPRGNMQGSGPTRGFGPMR